MDKELVLYCQTRYNPYAALARDLLGRYKIPFKEIDVDVDAVAAAQVQSWTGGLSLPTLIVASPGDVLPVEPPAPLKQGQPARGVDRGSLIAAPNNRQLEDWLHKHGFLNKPYTR